MRKMTALLIAICLAVTMVQAAGNRDKSECARIREKIRKIESRMRAGYTNKQGEKYNEQLRKLKAKRYELCR